MALFRDFAMQHRTVWAFATFRYLFAVLSIVLPYYAKRRVATREERIGHYLGRLAPGHAGSRPEIRPVQRRVARLPTSSTRIALYGSRNCQCLYPLPEGAGRWYVLEGLLPGGWSGKPSRLCDYLAGLSTRHIGVGAEVDAGARFSWTATRIA